MAKDGSAGSQLPTSVKRRRNRMAKDGSAGSQRLESILMQKACRTRVDRETRERPGYSQAGVWSEDTSKSKKKKGRTGMLQDGSQGQGRWIDEPSW